MSNEVMSVEGQLVGMPLAGPESFSTEQLAYLKKALGLDETVLFEKEWADEGAQTYSLSEAIENFAEIRVFYSRGGKNTIGSQLFRTADLTSSKKTVIHAVANGSPTYMYWTELDFSASCKLTTIKGGYYSLVAGTSALGSGVWLIPTKVVGIHRVAEEA